MTQETQSNIEIFLNGLMTIVIMSVGATMIIAGTLDVGLLIGSNILAARALQGTSKYAKAIDFLKQRDQAVGEIVNYVQSKQQILFCNYHFVCCVLHMDGGGESRYHNTGSWYRCA